MRDRSPLTPLTERNWARGGVLRTIHPIQLLLSGERTMFQEMFRIGDDAIRLFAT